MQRFKAFSIAALALLTLVAGFAALTPHSAAQDTQASRRVKPQVRPRIDVVFTIDATGSMGDEIEMVKKEVWNIANGLMAAKPSPDIRFGLVFYQDKGDAFLVKKTQLTRDVDRVHDELMAVHAGGGGDWREHVGRGLHEAVNLNWDLSQNTSRMVYLVGDAPGHDDYQDGYDIPSAVRNAKQKGITIHAIGCSGLGAGESEFATIAAGTGGMFEQLTYQQIVKGSDGKDRSVVYYDGEVYEADGVLSEIEWGAGGKKLLKDKKLKKAAPATRRRASGPGARTKNNLDKVMFESIKGEAEAKGAVY